MSLREVPDWVSRYVGIPHVPGGKSRDGADCWGLFNLVAAEQLGLALPPYEGPIWHDGDDPARIGPAVSEYAHFFRPVEAGGELCGDGILFRMRGHPLHLAMVVAPGYMLHVEGKAMSCVERYRSPNWERRILGFYRGRG